MTDSAGPPAGDQINIAIGSNARYVAAGKNVQQKNYIYQAPPRVQASRWRRMTKPLWAPRAWRCHCRELAHSLAQSEGVDREYSELMALRSPSDVLILWENREYQLSTLIDELAVPRIVILGEPGSGKTTSLKHLAMVQADRARHSIGQFSIPIFAPLTGYTGDDLLAFLQNAMSDELAALLPEYLANGRMTVFFDALNEMPGDQYDHNIRLLREFIDRHDKNRYIFSCRTEYYHGELSLQCAQIQPLDPNRIKQFALGYLGADGEAFYNRLMTENVIELVRNPLFLWMVLKTKDLPTSRGSLFAQYIDTLLRREESKGDVYRPYSEAPDHVLKSALEHLAFMMTQQYRTRVIAATEAVNLLNQRPDLPQQYDYLAQGCERLILRYQDVRQRNLQYWHHTIQEYFAAAYLEQRFATLDDSAVNTLCSDHEWWETLVLLAGLVESSAPFIRRVLGDGSNAKRVVLAAALLYNTNQPVPELEEQVRIKLTALFRAGFDDETRAALISLATMAGKKFLLRLEHDLFELGQSGAECLIKVWGDVGGADMAAVLASQLGLNEFVDVCIYQHLPRIGAPIVPALFDQIAALQPVLQPPDNNVVGWSASVSHRMPALDDAGSVFLDNDRLSRRLSRYIAKERIIAAIAQLGDVAVEPLSQIVRQRNDHRTRLLVAEILGQIPYSERAVAALCEWLGDEDAALNQTVIKSLQQLGGERVTFMVGQLLKDRNWRKRLAAVEVLGKIETGTASDFLAEARRDSNLDVRGLADYLLERRNPRLFTSFRSILYDPAGVRQLRQEAKNAWTSASAEEGLPKEPPGEYSMTLFQHIDELRTRAWLGLITMWLHTFVAVLLYGPAIAPSLQSLYGYTAVGPIEARTALAACLDFGLMMMVPVLIYQAWRFIVPGLTPRERRIGPAIIMGIMSFPVLVFGAAFGLSHSIVIAFGQTLADADATIAAINRLTMALIVLMAITLLWLTVRLASRYPAIYDTITVILIGLLGQLVALFIGTERIQRLKRMWSETDITMLRGGWGRYLGTVLVIVLIIVVPIYTYGPILITIGLLLFSIPSTQYPQIGRIIAELLKALISIKAELGRQWANRALKSHVIELRNRLALACFPAIVVSIGFIALFFPQLRSALAMIYAVPDAALAAYLESSFLMRIVLLLNIAGVALVPLLAFQLWRFATPGLEPRERKYGLLALPFVMGLPLIAIALAALYSRLIGDVVKDVPSLIFIANACALVTIALVMIAISLLIMSLLRLGRSWRVFAYGVAVIAILMIILWPIWVYAAIVLLSTVIAVVLLSRLLKITTASASQKQGSDVSST